MQAAARHPQRNKVPQSFLHPRLTPPSTFSFLSQVSSLPRYTSQSSRHRNSIFPKLKPSVHDWFSRLPSARLGVELKMEWQTETELKLLCSSP